MNTIGSKQKMQKVRKHRNNKLTSKANIQQFTKEGPQPPPSSSTSNSAQISAPPTSSFHDEVELMNFKHLLAGRFAQNQDLLEILLERSMLIQNIIAPDCYPSADLCNSNSPFNIWIGNLEKVKELMHKNEKQVNDLKRKTPVVNDVFLEVTQLINDFDKEIFSTDDFPPRLIEFQNKYYKLKKKGGKIPSCVASGNFIKKANKKLRPKDFSRAPENWTTLKAQIEEQIAKKKRDEDERLRKIQEEKERLERERKQKEEEEFQRKKREREEMLRKQEELLRMQKVQEELKRAEEEKNRKQVEEEQKQFIDQQQQIPLQIPTSISLGPDIIIPSQQIQQPQQIVQNNGSVGSSEPQEVFSGIPDSGATNFDNIILDQSSGANFLSNNDNEFSLDPSNNGDLNDLGGFMQTDNFEMYSTLDDNDFLNQINHSMD